MEEKRLTLLGGLSQEDLEEIRREVENEFFSSIWRERQENKRS